MAAVVASSEPRKWEGGELLFAGGTDWATLGRSSGKQKKGSDDADEREAKYPTLMSPTRIKNLQGVRIMFVGGGSAATHCIAGDADGRLWTWGRNEKGQLGHGDLIQRNMPTVVKGLSSHFVVGGASGKHHTIVFTNKGDGYSFGLNSQGQLGVGSIKVKGKAEELYRNPAKALVENVTAVSCGVDFSMWLCGGRVYTAGNPQYGQTGDGSDHQYNAKDSSVQLMHEPQPTPKPVLGLNDVTIIKIAAGQNHCVAADDAGSCYTWGNGGYGRLGHRVQKDEFAPKKVEEFKARLTVAKDPVVAAGSTSSFCTIVGGQLFGWGKLKTSGDNMMYPHPMYDLQGWNVRSMSCGPNTYAIAADNSVIIWGNAINGELGYGADGKKSSANPAKCDPLEGMYTQQVACGSGWTLFLVDPKEERLAKMRVHENTIEEPAPVEDNAVGAGDAGGGKGGRGRGGKAAGGGRGKGAAAEAAPAAGKRKAEAAAPAGRGRGKKAK